MTTALAHAVGPQGHVTTYEAREEMINLARKNISRLGMEERVTFKHADIKNGFDEQDIIALFMDIPNPETYLSQVKKCLVSGGFLGCILPTSNQVIQLLPALRINNFAFIEVCEILLRYHKPVPERLRPTDRMVAHTGYLVFARSIIAVGDIDQFEK
jgi:tRNA (adenine57-N1/adenine58-N1)-methyltransferase